MQDFFDPNPAGTPIWATIHSQVPLAAPGTVLATTDTLVFMPGGVATGGEWFTLRLDGNSLPLTAGTYFIALHEVDSTLTLGTSPEILTPSSVWVTWATMPTPTINGWNTSESFNIFIQYNLRMNFGVSTISVNEIEGNSNLISLFPSPAVNEVNIRLDNQLKNSNIAVYNSIGALVSSINNVNGNTKLDVSTFAHGIYTVIVSAEGKSYSKRFTIAK